MIESDLFVLGLKQKPAKCLLNVNYVAPWKEIKTLSLSNNTILCFFCLI